MIVQLLFLANPVESLIQIVPVPVPADDAAQPAWILVLLHRQIFTIHVQTAVTLSPGKKEAQIILLHRSLQELYFYLFEEIPFIENVIAATGHRWE